MSISSVSRTNFASLSAAMISASTNSSPYTNQQLADMTAAQIGAITPGAMAALNKNQIRYFQPQALADGLVTYLSNNSLTALPANAKLTSGLTEGQIKLFTAPVVNASMSQMSKSQIKAIATDVISQISTDVLRSLSGVQLNALTAVQIGQLSQGSIEQLGNLKPEQISTLSAEWLNNMPWHTIQYFYVASFTLPQLKGLDTTHVKALSGYQVGALSREQIRVLNDEQIKAIDLGDIDNITPLHFADLKQNQLKALTTDQIGYVSSEQVNKLSRPNIAIFSYQQISRFTDNVVTNLSGQLLGALTKTQINQGLDGRKIGMLNPTQVKDAEFKKDQIQALHPDAVDDLDVEDLKVLTDTQLTYFKVDQLANFTGVQIAWVHDNKRDTAGFTSAKKNKINERYAATH